MQSIIHYRTSKIYSPRGNYNSGTQQQIKKLFVKKKYSIKILLLLEIDIRAFFGSILHLCNLGTLRNAEPVVINPSTRACYFK